MTTRVRIPSVEEFERRVAEGNPFLTAEEHYAMFDEAVRRELGIEAEEFIRRWNAGEYAEIADKPGHRHILELGMIIPTLACADP
jgi:hypothetical protein